MSQRADDASRPESEQSEPARPLNRAERRAQRRGKQPPLPQAGNHGPVTAHRTPVVVPRRSGRRGNR